MAQLGNIFNMEHDIHPGPVFQCEFNGSVHFVIRLTIFGNFFIIYVYVLYTIFQCKFSCDSDCVIWRLYFDNIWYGHHLALVIYTAPWVFVQSTWTVWSLSQSLWTLYDCEVSVQTSHIIGKCVTFIQCKTYCQQLSCTWSCRA